MSRWIGLLSLFFWTAYLTAAPTRLDRLKVGTQIYTNVTIVGVNATDLYFSNAKGIKNVKLRLLDPATQKLFEYDAAAASQAEKLQSEEDARYQLSLATEIASAAGRPASKSASTNKVHETSEESVADPVSEGSLIGKTGPPLELEKWIGPSPIINRKFTLLVFWAPWSIPCRKWVPQLGALTKKFPDKLLVLGVLPDADSESRAGELGAGFPSVVDEKGKLNAAVGVKSVPCVVLMDPTGVVLYEGHPAALGEKELKGLFAKTPATGAKEAPGVK